MVSTRITLNLVLSTIPLMILLWTLPLMKTYADEPEEGVVIAAQQLHKAGKAARTVHQSSPISEVVPFNDPLYGEQWYLDAISLTAALDAVTANIDPNDLHPVIVAVIDSGIDVNHPEFRGQLLQGFNYIAPGAPPIDDFGEGTHVAGLISARQNNAIGIVGVSADVHIAPYKILNITGRGTITNYAQAVRDAADNGADIIFLGAVTPTSSTVLDNAVKYAYAKGVLLISPVGDSSLLNVLFPAAFEEVMAVAATTITNSHVISSNIGAEVELAAPGGDEMNPILSTWPGGIYCASSKRVEILSTYCHGDGTFNAAALVTGAAALLWSIRPELTAEQIRYLLRDTARPLNAPASAVGTGLLDLHTAVRYILPPDLQLSTAKIQQQVTINALPLSTTITLSNPSIQPITWTVSAPSAHWLSIIGDSHGTVRYDAPHELALQLTSAGLSPGCYRTEITVTGAQTDLADLIRIVDVELVVADDLDHLPLCNSIWLPFVSQ